MLIPKIEIRDVADKAAVEAAMSNLSVNKIGCVNWKDEFPSQPEVSFKIAHNGENLFLQYTVHEDEILARVKHDNGEVWTDSCVEFFISFADSPYYYNLELTCIGKALLGYRKVKNESEHAADGVMQSIKRWSTLGTANFDKIKGDHKWTLQAVIPISAFWKSDMKSFDGLKARGNFYKCGDNLTEPHFLSWMPILTEKPNFHIPQYFGELDFQ